MVPFMLVSYAAGLAGVRLAPYAVGTAVGVLPGSILYVGVGTSLPLLSSWAPSWPVSVLLVALTAMSLAAVTLWHRRRASARRG